MNGKATAALMRAADVDRDAAELVLANLEAEGLTIYRKKVSRRGRRPNASEKMTPQLGEAIRAYFRAYPNRTQHQIANTFNVNVGRVNEALDHIREGLKR